MMLAIFKDKLFVEEFDSNDQELVYSIGRDLLHRLSISNDETKTDYIEQIHTAAERARKLTSKLLTFSKKGSGERSVTNINTLLLAEQHMLEKTLTARINFSLELDNNLWPVLLEQNLFQDSILNICINAMHAMPDGGRLTINTCNKSINETDKFTELSPGDYVQISITDTGSGMDKATRQKIFDPFFSTKGDKGTGLGMSQVYGFVTSSGGGIHLYSEPNLGTKITIYLPRYLNNSDNTEQNITSKNTETHTLSGSETILVVDDEPSLASLICNILNTHGYKTINTNSAKQALQALQENHIDLIISDIIMPEMDGYQLAENVIQKYPDIKIIHISGFSGDHQHQHLSQDLALINKPFSAKDLLELVRSQLDDK